MVLFKNKANSTESMSHSLAYHIIIHILYWTNALSPLLWAQTEWVIKQLPSINEKMGSIRWGTFYVQNLMMMGVLMLNEMCQGSPVRMHFLMHSSQMYEAEQVGNKSCLHLPHDWRHESVDPRSAERCTGMWAKYAANKHWTHSKTFEKPPHIHLSLHLAAEWKYDKI